MFFAGMVALAQQRNLGTPSVSFGSSTSQRSTSYMTFVLAVTEIGQQDNLCTSTVQLGPSTAQRSISCKTFFLAEIGTNLMGIFGSSLVLWRGERGEKGERGGRGGRGGRRRETARGK